MSGSNPYPWRQGRGQPQIDVSNQAQQQHQMGSEQQSALESGGFYVAKQPTLHYGSGGSSQPKDVGHAYIPKTQYVPQAQSQDLGMSYGPPPSRNPPQVGASNFPRKPQNQPQPQSSQEFGSYYAPKPVPPSGYSAPSYIPPPQAPSYQPPQQQQQQQQPPPQQQPQQSSGRTITQISIGQLSSPPPQQVPSQPQFPQQQQQYQQPQQQYQPPQQQYQQPIQQQYQPQQYQQPQQQPQQQQQYQPYQSAPPGGSLPQHLQQQRAPPAQQQPQFQEQPIQQRRRGKFTGAKKVFNPEQVARYRRVFDAFDSNKNGVLEAYELLNVARELGYRLPREQLDDILRSFDMDQYGVLSFDEFLEAMPGNYDLIPEDEHRRAEIRLKFQEFDRDCNGYITRDEAYGVLNKELGFDWEKSNSLINQFDINSDGQLSYEEFVGFYMKVRERKDAIDVAFRQFDRDNKGYVSMEDAKRILKGVLFSDHEVEAIVRSHDANQDGKLQYDEFVHFWTA